METSNFVAFIKRFDILLVTVVALAIIIVVFKNSLIIEPDIAMGAGLMVYTCVWCVFAFVRWYNGKRWNY